VRVDCECAAGGVGTTSVSAQPARCRREPPAPSDLRSTRIVKVKVTGSSRRGGRGGRLGEGAVRACVCVCARSSLADQCQTLAAGSTQAQSPPRPLVVERLLSPRSAHYFIISLLSFNTPKREGWLGSRMVSVLALRRRKARVRIAVATLSGNSLRQTVHTHCASVHQAAKLVAALLSVAGVTAGLADSKGSLLPGL